VKRKPYHEKNISPWKGECVYVRIFCIIAQSIYEMYFEEIATEINPTVCCRSFHSKLYTKT
jgi:hypothetical protein